MIEPKSHAITLKNGDEILAKIYNVSIPKDQIGAWDTEFGGIEVLAVESFDIDISFDYENFVPISEEIEEEIKLVIEADYFDLLVRIWREENEVVL